MEIINSFDLYLKKTILDNYGMCLGAKSSKEERVFRSEVFQGGNGAEEQRVPGSKVCWEAKCSWQQKVLRGKGGWGAKCSKQLNIPWGKVCWGVNCNKPIWSKLFFWAKVNNAKCSQKVKCVLMQSVHQPARLLTRKIS